MWPTSSGSRDLVDGFAKRLDQAALGLSNLSQTVSVLTLVAGQQGQIHLVRQITQGSRLVCASRV